MTTLLFANNAGSTLSGSLSSGATSLTLAAGGGAQFPNPGAGQYFIVTAIDAATGLLREIMWCTARSSDTLTVVRGQEGTTPQSWNAGDLIQMLVTAGMQAQFLQQGANPTSSVFFGADIGIVNAMAATVTPVVSALADGMIFEINPANTNINSSVTLNISGLGALHCYRSDGSALFPGDFSVNGRALFSYSATDTAFLLLNPNTWVSQTAVAASPGGRLTLSSGVPIAAPTIGATSVIYTPYTGGQVPVWNGTVWSPKNFTEVSQLLSDTTYSPTAAVANTLYDMFVWINSSGNVVLSRGPAWTNATTRSLNLSRVAGVLTNAAGITNGPAVGYGVYVGTIATDTGAATVTYNPSPAAASGGPSGGAWIGLWNYYNRVDIAASAQDSKASWGYASTSWQAADASNNNRITAVSGLASDGVLASYIVSQTNAAGNVPYIGVGVNSITAPLIGCEIISVSGATSSGSGAVTASIPPFSGQSYIQALEAAGAGNATFVGSTSTPVAQLMALNARLRF